MSDARSGASGAGAGRGGGTGASRSGEFQASVSRLERAVDELVTVAREQVSERATSLLDETAERLERQLDRRESRHHARGRVHRLHGMHGLRRLHRGDRASACSSARPETRPRRLYRDPKRVKIGGVCAGIARYYGMEPWVVRCIAVTGLLFFPTIVFPAYWIAYFVMDKPPKPDVAREPDPARHGRNDHRSPTPEFGPRFSPRYSLRNVEADLTEVELRLRRMETHVTSGQYELQRELNKIDGGSDGRRG